MPINAKIRAVEVCRRLCPSTQQYVLLKWKTGSGCTVLMRVKRRRGKKNVNSPKGKQTLAQMIRKNKVTGKKKAAKKPKKKQLMAPGIDPSMAGIGIRAMPFMASSVVHTRQIVGLLAGNHHSNVYLPWPWGVWTSNVIKACYLDILLACPPKKTNAVATEDGGNRGHQGGLKQYICLVHQFVY